MRIICVELFRFWTRVREMLLSDICFFSSVSHFVKLSYTIYSIGRGQYEKHLCEIILNLDQ